jgi:hypothetical protein
MPEGQVEDVGGVPNASEQAPSGVPASGIAGSPAGWGQAWTWSWLPANPPRLSALSGRPGKPHLGQPSVPCVPRCAPLPKLAAWLTSAPRKSLPPCWYGN